MELRPRHFYSSLAKFHLSSDLKNLAFNILEGVNQVPKRDHVAQSQTVGKFYTKRCELSRFIGKPEKWFLSLPATNNKRIGF